jgi:predicted nucleotidyltransferase
MVALVEQNSAALAALCRQFHVKWLELFGSAARGELVDATSDLDFLVEFLDMPDGEHANAYFGLLEGLPSLIGRKVDLVVARAIRNPYFRESVNRDRTLVYADDITRVRVSFPTQ